MYGLYINGELISVYNDYDVVSYEANHLIQCGDDVQVVELDNEEQL